MSLGACRHECLRHVRRYTAGLAHLNFPSRRALFPAWANCARRDELKQENAHTTTRTPLAEIRATLIQ
jgi:hypothetical protein